MRKVGRVDGLVGGCIVAFGTACGGSSFTVAATDGGSDGQLPTDANEDVDAGCAPLSPTWCTNRTESFCDDFDESTSLPGKWDSVNQLGATAAVGVPSVCPPSPPNALLATFSAGDAGTPGAVLSKVFPLTTKSPALTLEFNVRTAATIAKGGAVGIAGIAMVGPGGGSASFLLTQTTLAVLISAPGDGGAPVVTTLMGFSPAPSPGEWPRLGLIVTPTTITATNHQIPFATGPTPFPFTGGVSIGIGGQALSASGEVDFDDVTFNIR